MTRTVKTCDSDKGNRPKVKHGPEMPPSGSVTRAQLQQMISNAPDHMIELLLSQFKILEFIQKEEGGVRML